MASSSSRQESDRPKPALLKDARETLPPPLLGSSRNEEAELYLAEATAILRSIDHSLSRIVSVLDKIRLPIWLLKKP